MTSATFTKLARATVLPAMAIGAMTAGALTLSSSEAGARARNDCVAKLRRCESRCLSKIDAASCVVRTCNRQYDNCTAVSSGGGTNK